MTSKWVVGVLAVGVLVAGLVAVARFDTTPVRVTLVAGDCDDATRTAMAEVVDGQLAAFLDRDWDAALAFASSDFRDDFDPASFAAVITDQFPTVANHVARDLGPCAIADTGPPVARGTIIVTVTDDDGSRQELAYLMAREDDTWRIGGAVPVETDREEPDPVA